jgi:hypothetical protein
MWSSISLDVIHAVRWKSTDVSEEHVSIFMFEEYAKQETNKKQTACFSETMVHI